MYECLHSYYLSVEKFPTFIKVFFERGNFVYAIFLQSQLPLFSEAILIIERDEIIRFEVMKAADLLKLNSREVTRFMNSASSFMIFLRW